MCGNRTVSIVVEQTEGLSTLLKNINVGYTIKKKTSFKINEIKTNTFYIEYGAKLDFLNHKTTRKSDTFI